jgi:hypothetical protein
MRRLTGLALITCLSVTASGCGLVDNVLGRFTGGGDENLEEDSTVILLDEEPEAETFEEPLLPGLPSAAEIASAELISSTSPSARLQQIERARQDPFALVAVPPPPTVAPPPAGGWRWRWRWWRWCYPGDQWRRDYPRPERRRVSHCAPACTATTHHSTGRCGDRHCADQW